MQPSDADCGFTDFHRGWMVEVVAVADGFRGFCYSPSGHWVQTADTHRQESLAYQSAIALIDERSARTTLGQLLREFYEQGKLDFQEWQALRDSVEPMWEV